MHGKAHIFSKTLVMMSTYDVRELAHNCSGTLGLTKQGLARPTDLGD